jgi:hypothetical protein
LVLFSRGKLPRGLRLTGNFLNDLPILLPMFRPPLLLLLALLAAAAGAQAQVITAGPDSAQVSSSKPTKKELAADSARRTERLFGLRLTRPQKAGYLALIPGAGQIYNRRYWKLPLVYGMLGGLGYGLYFQQKAYREYVDASEELAINPPAAGQTLLDVLSADKYPRARRERSVTNVTNSIVFYRRYRDLFVLFNALGYSLQILDAVVDAHLYDFNVSDDLSLRWQPTLLPVPGQALPGMGFTAALVLK